MEFNGTYQFLADANDVTLLDANLYGAFQNVLRDYVLCTSQHCHVTSLN
jgi:hypothetical protein